MAGRVSVALERRAGSRLSPEQTPWRPDALLRPGQDVRLVNVGGGGALIESAARMHPGARTELQLNGPARCVVRGRIERCRVTALDPVLYEGAMVFDHQLDWAGPGSG
ncbi:MAG TPA: hypothetical protein VNJ02_11595 [Vicinamibacterales bacterium]|nr:hypothetical protein [Vicinamibacterales bacterium]